MSDRLAGEACIITGTGGTMGRDPALTFAREGALDVGCGLYADDAEEMRLEAVAVNMDACKAMAVDTSLDANCACRCDSFLRNNAWSTR